ncbi:hypothetical protein ACKC9G_03300 [Pokkaliibacter sp. CJK22405]|uniref:hypothetical protein n=1 Tax=Pokkaliibacter sp. CJK22405 TaxID=3384615 RepID=UPI003985312F
MMLSWLQWIILAFVQGMSFALPISGDAPNAVAFQLFAWPVPGNGFLPAVELGALVSLIVFLWPRQRLGWYRRETALPFPGLKVMLAALPVFAANQVLSLEYFDAAASLPVLTLLAYLSALGLWSAYYWGGRRETPLLRLDTMLPLLSCALLLAMAPGIALVALTLMVLRGFGHSLLDAFHVALLVLTGYLLLNLSHDLFTLMLSSVSIYWVDLIQAFFAAFLGMSLALCLMLWLVLRQWLWTLNWLLFLEATLLLLIYVTA